MKIYFYTNVAFEKWDYENSVKEGIGGSETSIVEMAWRLAKRGHDVIVYAPIKKTTNPQWRNTTWINYKKADFTQKGLWILYRCPDIIDKFIPKVKGQTLWFMMQDWDYPTWTDKRIKRMDKVITLCVSHGKFTLKNHSNIGRKLWISSNGIKIDLIEATEKKGIKRNQYRVMHASSPDRGLKQALLSFRKAKQIVPELEFHAFYGFNNLEKLAKNNPFIAENIKELKHLLKQPGVTFHGRVSQNELYEEWFKSGIYIYETNFFETSNIASQEAQAMGAIPVFSPVFAQGENIKHGIGVEGDSNDPLTNDRFAAELVKLATHPEVQEQIRPEMMAWARKRFDWENFVTQWEYEARGRRKDFERKNKFPEQLKFSITKKKKKGGKKNEHRHIDNQPTNQPAPINN